MGYHTDAYRKVVDELARRREDALHMAEVHKGEFYALAPEAKEIDAALSTTAGRIFEAAMSGEEVEAKVAAIRRENEELIAARGDLLLSHGLPRNYTDPHYTCPHCQDTGFVMAEMCTCMREMLQLEHLRLGGVANADTQTFETFSLDYYGDTPETYARMKENLEIAKQMADTFVPGKENLLLMGGTGLGKTHLSTAIARRVIEKGYTVVYETVQTVFSDFEYDHFRNSYSAERGRAQKYLDADLLILDDLGTEFSTQFTLSCLYQLVNTRLLRGLSTVISTNLNEQELIDRYDNRLASRFVGNYRPVSFVGHDIRIQKLREG